MAQDPASVRYFNPGAMYPGPSSRRFGSTGHEIIGGGHQIAVFPDAERGAAAQFDLLARNYSNMTIADALRKWSGGTSADAYIANVAQRTGLQPDTVITPAFLQSPQGLALVRSMAQHEAGRAYPLSDEQWANAQRLAFGNGAAASQISPPAVTTTTPASPPPQIAESPPAATPSGLGDNQRLDLIRAALNRDNQQADPMQLDLFGEQRQARSQDSAIPSDEQIPMAQLPQMRRPGLQQIRAALAARRTARV